MSWTSDQIQADIRSVQRTCLGEPLLAREDQVALTARWHQITAAADFAAGMNFKTAVEFAVGADAMDVADNDWDALFRRVASLVYGFRGNCGYDFNEIVLSNPLDGQQHEYTCPKCGTTGAYQAPKYD